jgi:hypothetical protein
MFSPKEEEPHHGNPYETSSSPLDGDLKEMERSFELEI